MFSYQSVGYQIVKLSKCYVTKLSSVSLNIGRLLIVVNLLVTNLLATKLLVT